MSDADATGMRRRDLLALIGTAAGSAVMYRAMTSLSLASNLWTVDVSARSGEAAASTRMPSVGKAAFIAPEDLAPRPAATTS